MKKSEFELINYIKNIIDKKHNKAYSSESGIGDDCAFIDNIRITESVVVTTDALVENVHFDLSYCSMYDIGYKSAVVNISDVIAKGAKPTQLFISLAIAQKLTDSDIESFYEGLTDALAPYNALIAGGDTTKSKSDFFISITAMGVVDKSRKILRSGAKASDNIYVLGRLGESAIGLDILQGNTKLHNQKCVEAHKKPTLFYDEFQQILNTYKVTSSLDVSDGLLQDLSHIAEASNVVCEVFNYSNFELVNDAYKNAQLDTQRESLLKYILGGGEDYAIAFTSPDNIAEAENLICIGVVCAADDNNKSSVIVYDKCCNVVDIANKGYTHF